MTTDKILKIVSAKLSSNLFFSLFRVKVYFSFTNSVTRWSAYFSVFGHLQQSKLAQKGHKFANVGSAIYKVKYKPSKICQRFVNFCQSGEISPNLVTLDPTHSVSGPGYFLFRSKDLMMEVWMLLAEVRVHEHGWPHNSQTVGVGLK